MSPWVLTYEGFDPEEEGLREALCTLGNGYFATRGAAPEAVADDVHYPGTYVAGLYNRLTSTVAGREVENEDLVNVPNWLPVTFRADDGPWFAGTPGSLVDHHLELDLKRGVLRRHAEVEDAEGRRTLLSQRRIVSMDDMHVAALQTTLQPINWSGVLTIRSGLDAGIVNAGVARYRDLAKEHLRLLEAGHEGDAIHVVVETTQSNIRVAVAARTSLHVDEAPVDAERDDVREAAFVAQDLRLPVETGRPVTLDKRVALHTSRDRAISEPGLASRSKVEELPGFDDLLRSHSLAWDLLWRRFYIEAVEGKDTQRNLNLHIFHLVQTASEHTLDLDVGVPARGWHGEAYRGHVFWDELFILPYISLRLPALTRSLLQYRRRRLGAARRSAEREGYDGALYPWQSGSDGREESQRFHLNPLSGDWHRDNSRLQWHINIAVAFNMWSYFEVTGDMEYLRFHGGKVLLETARFWASAATYDRARDRYEIRGVMGPDEYHDGYPGADEAGLNNNAYTNVMVVWVLLRALELLELLPDPHRLELAEELRLRPEELDRWEEISRQMFVPFHDGVLSQFEGYEELEPFDVDAYRSRYGNIRRLDRILRAEGDTTNRYQVSKQADVLMLFYLLSPDELADLFERLGYDFDPETDIPRNIAYYERRTVHGSTLSGVVQAWVLARSDRRRSWEYFNEALQSDVSDIQDGTTPEGIHLGAMAGTVDLAQRCYGGIEPRHGMLLFDPIVPDELERLRFTLHYRQHRLEVTITQERLRVAASPSIAPSITVGCRGETVVLEAGSSVEWAL
jgi:alpha,alpha-trehalase